MEYQILLEMIKELEDEMSDPEVTNSDFSQLWDQRATLTQLRNRIDKAREADIIAMSNEGCI